MRMKIWWKTRFVISSKCRILLFGFVRINHLARQYLESFVIKKRDKKAALKFMNKAMRRYREPNEIATDKLGSYTAAAREMGYLEKQVTKRCANNRVENSHLPFLATI